MRANVRFAKMNPNVAQVVPDTGAEPFNKSTRYDKGSLGEAEYVFGKAEKSGRSLYLYIF